MPNVDVLWPIQVAIYSRLTGDGTLMGKITGVFDDVPASQPFPYVTIGASTSTPQGAHDRFGARTTTTLHVWSTYAGAFELLDIGDDLMRLFDHQPLTVDGHHTVYMHHQQTVTVPDPDDVRHLAVRFSIETEYTA